MHRRHPRRPRIPPLILTGLLAAGLWVAGILNPDSLMAGWSAQPAARTCRVDRVRDGDSLSLTCGGRTTEVRLHCIDAPEWDQNPWGQQSRRHLEEIAPREVELVERDQDRYGRTVADVYAPGRAHRLLNLEQVQAGQAAVYTPFCTDGRFAQAQRAARKARLGIWSRPGEQQTPWVFRHRRSH